MNLPPSQQLRNDFDAGLASNSASERIRLLIKGQVARSKRQGSWFTISHRERSLISLALSLKVKFESLDLLRAVVSVFRKLREGGKSTYSHLLRGTKLAWMFSDAAVSWGNIAARSWRHDMQFIAFLGRNFPA